MYALLCPYITKQFLRASSGHKSRELLLSGLCGFDFGALFLKATCGLCDLKG